MENNIKERLYNCLNPLSIPMMEFLKLADIEYSNDVDTACVTCSGKPKLLINKDFIDEYCKTDEELFMLLMHELYHIILGHTKLFKRISQIDNLVFDAVINSMLCRMFNTDLYTSFFKKINPSNKFPSCILRPVDKNTPKKYVPLLNSLYESNKGTYLEVYETLRKEIKLIDKGNYVLVGNHDSIEYDDDFEGIYRKMVEGWPRETVIEGRDEFGELVIEPFLISERLKEKKKRFYNFLKKIGLTGNNAEYKSYGYEDVDVKTFVPNIKDRFSFAKKIFYNSVIYNNTSSIYKNTDNLGKTYIYLDVSGSVYEEVKDILYLLEKPLKENMCELYSFSTEVEEITYDDYLEGNIETTYGTDINCCFEHFFSEKRNVQKIVILTDGYTGRVYSNYLDKLKGISIYCLLFTDKTTEEDLKNIVKEFVKI